MKNRICTAAFMAAVLGASAAQAQSRSLEEVFAQTFAMAGALKAGLKSAPHIVVGRAERGFFRSADFDKAGADLESRCRSSLGGGVTIGRRFKFVEEDDGSRALAVQLCAPRAGLPADGPAYVLLQTRQAHEMFESDKTRPRAVSDLTKQCAARGGKLGTILTFNGSGNCGNIIMPDGTLSLVCEEWVDAVGVCSFQPK